MKQFPIMMCALCLAFGTVSFAQDRKQDLKAAAIRGDAAVVSVLLDSVTAKDIEGFTGLLALQGAAKAGHADVVKLLLEVGAGASGSRSSGLGIALMRAVQGGHTDVVRLLVEAGAHPHAGTGNESAWEYAKQQGRDDLLEILSRSRTLRPHGEKAPQVPVRTKVDSIDKAEWKKQLGIALALLRRSYPDGAYEPARKALVLSERLFGESHVNTALTLSYLSKIERVREDYVKAEEYARRVIGIREQAYDEDHPAVARARHDLLNLIWEQGKASTVDSLARASLETWEACLNSGNLTDASREYLTTSDFVRPLYHLNSLGWRQSEPRPRSAELLGRAIEIRRRGLGRAHATLLKHIINLAGIFVAEGDLHQAESLYQSAISEWRSERKDGSLQLALLSSRLSQIQGSAGKLAESESNCKDAIEVLDRLHTESTEAEVEKRVADLSQAASRIDRVDTPDGHRSRCRDSLVEQYAIRGQFDKAAAFLTEVKRPHDPDIIVDVERMRGHTARGAESLYQLFLHLGGQETEEERASRMERILVLSGKNAWSLDREYLERVLERDRKTIDMGFEVLAEDEMIELLAQIRRGYSIAQTAVAGAGNRDPELVLMGLNTALERKGIGLDSFARGRWFLSLGMYRDRGAEQIIRKLRSVDAELASRVLSGLKAGYRLTELKRVLEVELTGRSKALVARRGPVTAVDVARRMDTSSVLVEYSRYREAGILVSTDAQDRYIAYVLHPKNSSHPLVVDLGAAAVIDSAIAMLRTAIGRSRSVIASHGESYAEDEVAVASRTVYDTIYEPLEQMVGEAPVVYLSVDSEVGLVPFGALIDSSGRYLIERHEFRYLSGGRDLLRFKSAGKRRSDITILADPSFAGRGSTGLLQRQGGSSLVGRKWAALPGTRSEAAAIKEALHGWKVKVYSGNKAEESKVRKLRSPGILHLATHGFFLDSKLPHELGQVRGLELPELKVTPDDRGDWTETPLLRSGIVLSGASHFSDYDRTMGENDGILTALEVSGLNLWGTDLVVLSACETGVGEARRGEGIIGLRRAFQLAGARTVITSLWSVPDDETATLMTDFYRRLKAGSGKSEALRHAQLTMIEKRRENYGAAHPYYWGAFVSVGEP